MNVNAQTDDPRMTAHLDEHGACLYCRYWRMQYNPAYNHVEARKVGLCRFNPPVVGDAPWPRTKHNDTCSRFIWAGQDACSAYGALLELAGLGPVIAPGDLPGKAKETMLI